MRQRERICSVPCLRVGILWQAILFPVKPITGTSSKLSLTLSPMTLKMRTDGGMSRHHHRQAGCLPLQPEESCDGRVRRVSRRIHLRSLLYIFIYSVRAMFRIVRPQPARYCETILRTRHFQHRPAAFSIILASCGCFPPSIIAEISTSTLASTAHTRNTLSFFDSCISPHLSIQLANHVALFRRRRRPRRIAARLVCPSSVWRIHTH